MSGVIILSYGNQSLDFLSKAAKLCSEGALMRTDVARMAGATFVIGDPVPLDEIFKRLSLYAIDQQKHKTPDLSFSAIEWLACGRRGNSSNAMFTVLTGVNAMSDQEADWHAVAHPYDPDDLDRCLGLLHAMPELRAELPKMASVSPSWAALIKHWDAIEQSHLDEVGLGWTKGSQAPKTYALMAKALEEAKS